MQRFAVLALSGLFLFACGGPGKAGRQPSWRKSSVAGSSSTATVSSNFIELAPSGLASAKYNDPPSLPAPESPLSSAILALIGEVSGELGMDPPVADGRLYRALDELAAITPLDTPPTYPLIEFAMQRNGIIEPSPHLIIVSGDKNQIDSITHDLRDGLAETLRSGRFKRVGLGVADRGDQDVILLAFQESAVQTLPIARELPAGGSTSLEGTLSPGFEEPHIYHTTESGEVVRLDLARIGSKGFRARFECGARIGQQQLEITAEDESGSTVLANFPVWCASKAPLSVRVSASDDDPSPSDRAEAEQRMFALLNADRAAHGLPALLFDKTLMEISRKHSDEMLQTGQVAHVSPTTGSAADRVKAGGVHTSVVLENVARAYGVAEAERGLMNSPGHRANILSSDVSIGITLGEDVSGRRELLVTQVFMRVPKTIAPNAVRAQAEQKIQSVKQMTVSKDLQAIAQAFASELAKGATTNEASKRASKSLDENAGGFARVSTLVTTVSDINSFDPKASLGDNSVRYFGVGIAQGNHPVMGDGAIFIVVLLAQK